LKDFAFESAFNLRDALLAKKFSVLEITDFFLEQIALENKVLNIFLYIDEEDARKDAKRLDAMIAKEFPSKPLFGIPSVVPDFLNLENTPTTFGSKLFKGQTQANDAVEIGNLKQAGAVILGKTNVSEFGLSYDTTNNLQGPCVNPWNHSYSAGGGAAGGAAAVAAGLAPIALATDFSGALRLSASNCGVLGMMPTRGRVPNVHRHLLPFTERMFLRKGAIARHAIDIAMVLNVLAQPDPRDPFCSCDSPENYVECIQQELPRKFKIGFSTNMSFFSAHPEVVHLLETGAEKLKSLGHTVEQISLNFSQDLLRHFQNLFTADRYVLIMKYLSEHPSNYDLLSNEVKSWLKLGNAVTGPQYAMGITYLGMIEQQIEHFLTFYDFLLTPADPLPPHKMGADILDTVVAEGIKPYVGLSAFLIPYNMSGHPAITVPIGQSSEGVPIGMQLIGRKFSERIMLILANQFEKAYPLRACSKIRE